MDRGSFHYAGSRQSGSNASTVCAMVVGEFTQDADVVVIGAGPAGYSCAFAAADAGHEVTLVDPNATPGGQCLTQACIPSKAMLHVAASAATATSAGLTGNPLTIDPSSVESWVKRCTNRLGKGLAGAADQRRITQLRGQARFLSNREIQVAGDEVIRLRFKRAVVCTGSRPSPHPELSNHQSVCTPEALAVDPSLAVGRVVVVGHDVVAVESAIMAQALGAKVSLYTNGSVLLPDIPTDLRDAVLQFNHIEVDTEAWSTPPQADLVVDAASRQANIEHLDLHVTDVQVKDNWIVTDVHLKTQAGRILAAGDCAGPPLWAGAALAQGRIAAESIDGQGYWEPASVPRLLFGPVEMSWSGDAVNEADVGTISVPWSYSGLAIAKGAAQGLTHLRWDRTHGTIIGAGAVGRGAAEFATAATIVVELGATLQDLADMVPAHPTCSELLLEAAQQALSES